MVSCYFVGYFGGVQIAVAESTSEADSLVDALTGGELFMAEKAIYFFRVTLSLEKKKERKDDKKTRWQVRFRHLHDYHL